MVEETALAPMKLDVDSMDVETAPVSYVDLVRSHVESYLRSADKWAVESNLHARVREWQEKVEPFLAEQDTRPMFDIHEYGTRILQGLGKDEGKTNTFDKLAIDVQQEEDVNESDEESPNSCQQYEVCRLFLASLQLANNGNVELQHADNQSSLEIVLLDNKLINEKLQTYQAPSKTLNDKTSVGESKRRKRKPLGDVN